MTSFADFPHARSSGDNKSMVCGFSTGIQTRSGISFDNSVIVGNRSSMGMSTKKSGCNV
jgi:hypothetical protein